MPIDIEGVTYFSATDILRAIGVARQTLWRWRKDRKIPRGRRYRDRQVVFTKAEVEIIREYANRLEPAELSAADQLNLFNAKSPKRRR
jgi:predicted DNA-binding transcriptional regulator AlpA